MPDTALSVVVCTRNRLPGLKRCLEAFRAVATPQAWELVIVDNCSSDGTSEYLSAWKPEHTDRPRFVMAREERRGLATARNKGWRTAAADIIAFTDDDCYVSPDYVDAVLQAFQDHTGAGFVGGRLLLYDSSDLKVALQELAEQRFFPPYSFIPAGAVAGANMAFRRTVLERIGGFDERLGAGTPFPCEDIDAVAAALWAGMPGVYDPRLVVHHHHGRKTADEAARLIRSYDAGRGAYYAKYIGRKASRREYGKAWLDSAKRDFPRMGQTFREFASALRYMAGRL